MGAIWWGRGGEHVPTPLFYPQGTNCVLPPHFLALISMLHDWCDIRQNKSRYGNFCIARLIGVRDEIAAGGLAKICPENAAAKPGGHL